MKVIIKFCGGCNPRIQREQLAARLAARLSPSGAGFYDPAAAECGSALCILINGCPSACGTPPAGMAEGRVLRVSGPLFAGRERNQEDLLEILTEKVREYFELEGRL